MLANSQSACVVGVVVDVVVGSAAKTDAALANTMAVAIPRMDLIFISTVSLRLYFYFASRQAIATIERIMV